MFMRSIDIKFSILFNFNKNVQVKMKKNNYYKLIHYNNKNNIIIIKTEYSNN